MQNNYTELELKARKALYSVFAFAFIVSLGLLFSGCTAEAEGPAPKTEKELIREKESLEESRLAKMEDLSSATGALAYDQTQLAFHEEQRAIYLGNVKEGTQKVDSYQRAICSEEELIFKIDWELAKTPEAKEEAHQRAVLARQCAVGTLVFLPNQ